MRKTIFGFLLLFFLLGCIPITQVKDNLFESKNPDVSIQVDTSFKYIGSHKYEETLDSSVGSMRPVHHEIDFSIFMKDKISANIPKSVIALSIRRSDIPYVSNLFPDSPKYLENKMINLGNEIYQFVTKIEYPNMKSGITSWLKDIGIILPTCVLTKRYARAVYPNTLMIIDYLEELPEGSHCYNWSNKEMFKDDQKEFIKSFSKRAQDSFKFVGYVENYIQTQTPQKSSKEDWTEKADKIKALGELLEKKLITQEEYNEKKKKLLEEF